MRVISQSDVKMARCLIQGNLRQRFRFLSYLLCYVDVKMKTILIPWAFMSSTFHIRNFILQQLRYFAENIVQSFKLNARWLIFDCYKKLLKMQNLLHDHVAKMYWFYKAYSFLFQTINAYVLLSFYPHLFRNNGKLLLFLLSLCIENIKWAGFSHIICYFCFFYLFKYLCNLWESFSLTECQWNVLWFDFSALCLLNNLCHPKWKSLHVEIHVCCLQSRKIICSNFMISIIIIIMLFIMSNITFM